MGQASTSMLGREVNRLRTTLRSLDRVFGRLAPLLSESLALNGSPKVNGKARPRLSAKARATMVLQGRYMGYMRQLKPRQKAQVRRIRETKGVRTAIARARELAQ